MSRIEKALELAAQLREASPAPEKGAPAAAVQETAAPTAEGAPARKGTATRTITIPADNRLMATVAEPHSGVSEQYRKLKSKLVHLTKGERLRNVVMVTSAVTGDGKSLTAANLAVSMAQEFDLTVLLVDADLRRPSIHRYFGFEGGVGLADCLQDGVDIADAIVKTNFPKLSVLPAGKEVAKPLELLDSKKMKGMIQEIKNRYHDRYVIIDTPPLLPFAEPRALAHLVDGIIFVVREGGTPKESVTEALEVLKGCHLLGMVLNESTMVNQEYSRYGEYYNREKSL